MLSDGILSFWDDGNLWSFKLINSKGGFYLFVCLACLSLCVSICLSLGACAHASVPNILFKLVWGAAPVTLVPELLE